MSKKHFVKLTNNKTVALIEGDNSLTIASTEDDRKSIGYYLCTISADGVMVNSYSGDASYQLTRDLDQIKTVADYIWKDDWAFAEENVHGDAWFDVPIDSEVGVRLVNYWDGVKHTLKRMNDSFTDPSLALSLISWLRGIMNDIATEKTPCQP